MNTNRQVAQRIIRAMVEAQQRMLQRRERGDVPGWVLITLMTAGIVTALWAFAGPALKDLFQTAIEGVKGPAQ